MTRPLPPAGHDDTGDGLNDDFLRAALRHAPDRDLLPPEAIDTHILASARRAALQTPRPGGARPAGWAARWVARSAGLRRHLGDAGAALLRPGPAAAFASLMLATVIGVMWRDGPPPERSTTADVAAPAATPPSKLARPAAAQTEREDAAANGAAKRQAPERRAGLSNSDDAKAVRPPSPLAAAAPVAPAETARPAPPGAVPVTPARQVPSATEVHAQAAEPADMEQPAPSPSSPNPSADFAFEKRARAAAPTPTGSASTAAPEVVDTLAAQRSPASRAAAPRAAATGARGESSAGEPPSDASAPIDPLAALASAGHAGAPASALGDLRRLTQGRWERVARPAAAARPAGRVMSGPDGAPLGSLHIDDDAVLWLPRDKSGQGWRAPLPSGTAAGLRARLAAEMDAAPTPP